MTEKPQPAIEAARTIHGNGVRRYPRFSLRMLLIAVTLVACVLGWGVYQYRRYQDERDAIDVLHQYHDTTTLTGAQRTPGKSPQMPEWEQEPVIDLAQLKHGRIYRPIETLMLNRGVLEDRTVQTLQKFPALRTLSLVKLKIRTKLDPIAGHPSLTNLGIVKTKLSDRDVDTITRLAHLRELTLTDGKLFPVNAAERISTLPLRGLTLGDFWVSDRALENIAANKSLKMLSLKKCTTSPHGLLQIGQLHELLWLDLSGTNVDDRLFTQFTFPNLAALDLTDCAITDEGARGIARNANLEHLVLRNTQITDQGVKELVAFKKLRAVDLTGCKLTQESQVTLSAMPSLDPSLVSTGPVP